MLALRYPAQTPGLCQSIGGLDRGTPDQFVPGHTRHHSTVTIAFLWQGRARCHWHRPSYLAGFVCPGNPGPPSYVSLHQLDGCRIMSAWLSPHTPTRGVPLICHRHRVLRRGLWSLGSHPALYVRVCYSFGHRHCVLRRRVWSPGSHPHASVRVCH